MHCTGTQVDFLLSSEYVLGRPWQGLRKVAINSGIQHANISRASRPAAELNFLTATYSYDILPYNGEALARI
jgi:hypothetical protein